MSDPRNRVATGRRRFASAMLAAVVPLAGCSGNAGTGDETGNAGDNGTRDGATTGPPDATTPAGTTGTMQATERTLDLREANVVAVEAERTGDAYRFDVTLYHDDDGEPGYANWWQVETLDGERLGRRELRHPHGTRRFVRSETIEIPSRTDRVVVRGHDETHGYGGRAMVVTLETGATAVVERGSEPVSVVGTADSAEAEN